MSKVSAAILHKMARNAAMLGLTVNSESQTAVVIENGSNDLTISYQDASFNPSMVGGVDDTVSPFLGIGTASPGKMVITGPGTAGTVGSVIDSPVAAQVLQMISALANDIILADSTHLAIATLRGNSDLLGMGQ
jgi:sugar (pentulose or hexulose) kinase